MNRFFTEIFANRILWTSILSWFIAQVIKIFIDLWRYKYFNKSLLISSGGMPSSHTSFVTAMTTSIGVGYGFDSPLFAISAIVSMVVMYDAAGVRRAAGKQAEVLNLLMIKLEDGGLKVDKKLKELLGHSPIEVACGALLGILVGLVFYY